MHQSQLSREAVNDVASVEPTTPSQLFGAGITNGPEAAGECFRWLPWKGAPASRPEPFANTCSGRRQGHNGFSSGHNSYSPPRALSTTEGSTPMYEFALPTPGH